ncbi:MAG: hypothetical protein VX589_01600 [Myxococcota bacterium]|nr:hypothetical protein [Myxococcota bacterium]
MGQDGSVGAASARNHRFGARIAGGNTRLVGGVEWIKALGRDGDPVPEPWALSAWTETNPWGPFIGYARFDLTDMNPKAQDSYRSVLDVGVGVRMPYADAGPDRQARLSLGYRRARAEAQATPIAGASSQTSTHVVFAQLTLDLGLTFTATAERKK